jgi:serine/threonine protein kinase
MLPVGAVVAGYRIERVLGTGGMGAVYLAQNPTLPRRDALKVLSTELSRDQEFRARFVREAGWIIRTSCRSTAVAKPRTVNCGSR